MINEEGFKIADLNGLWLRYSNCSSDKDLWLVHGLCESGECFEGVFKTPIRDEFNIYVLDMPGCGRSELRDPELATMGKTTDLLIGFIKNISLFKGKAVYLAGHSMGAIITILIARTLQKYVQKLINIEGTVVDTPWRGSYKVDEYVVPEAFKEFMYRGLYTTVTLLQQSGTRNFWFERYLGRLAESNPTMLYEWCKSNKEFTKDDFIGECYRELPCEKCFMYGSKTHMQPEVKFIRRHLCDRKKLSGLQHWLMLEDPKAFYENLAAIL